MKSIRHSAFNGRPGSCLFGGQAVIGLFGKAYKVRRQYLTLKFKTPFIEGCNTFEFAYQNHPAFAGRHGEARRFDARVFCHRGG